MLRESGATEIEVSGFYDEVSDYTAMQLKQFIFHVDQPFTARAQEELAPIGAQLKRTSHLELPAWSHAGRPALTNLFQHIRDDLAHGKLGFVGSTGARVGIDWMKSLTQLLYDISTFHDNFKTRGFKIPDRFAFSKGANDCSKKGKTGPKLTQLIIASALATAQTLALFGFLDDERWTAWKSDMDAMAVGLNSVLDDLENRASSEAARAHKVQKTIGAGWNEPARSGAPVFCEATSSVNMKYNELDMAVGSLQPYHPLSLTGFEPTSKNERYDFLMGLALSMPCAILKVDVGGAIGTLNWVLKRDVSLLDADSGQLEDARTLLQPVIPQIHSRALRRQFATRVSGLVKMSESVRTFLYKELTGDESTEMWLGSKEKVAFVQKQVEIAEVFALAIGEIDIIVDLRTIANEARTGTTAFAEFWQCVGEELDAMNTAADERRHGGVVAYLSELVSHQEVTL